MVCMIRSFYKYFTNLYKLKNQRTDFSILSINSILGKLTIVGNVLDNLSNILFCLWSTGIPADNGNVVESLQRVSIYFEFISCIFIGAFNQFKIEVHFGFWHILNELL